MLAIILIIQVKNTVKNENNNTTEEDNSVLKPIEEARIDTFVQVAEEYGNAGRTLWAADGLTCNGTISSEITDGEYYIEINTAETKDPETNTFSTNEAITGNKPIFSVKITDDIHYILDNKEYLSLNSEDSIVKYKDALIDYTAIKCIENY